MQQPALLNNLEASDNKHSCGICSKSTKSSLASNLVAWIHQIIKARNYLNRFYDITNFEVGQVILIFCYIAKHSIPTIQYIGITRSQLTFFQQPKYLARGRVVLKFLFSKIKGVNKSKKRILACLKNSHVKDQILTSLAIAIVPKALNGSFV